jgi:fructosamine-3-kinase
MIAFRKHRPGAPADYYAIEAAGLRWLLVPGGPAVAGVIDVSHDHLDLQRITPASVGPSGLRDFGARLAHLHCVAAPAFGCPPEGIEGSAGYIADLPLLFGQWDSFGSFYAEARITPYLKLLGSRGALDSTHNRIFGELCEALHDPDSAIAGPAEPPRRIHGDLWSGNVVWGRSADAPDSAPAGWLIDPAAHGGHREADLAMLALFGQPGLTDVLAGYQARAPLATGWAQRIPLHQVHPLLVHSALFGGGYLAQATRAAQLALGLR